MDNETKYVNVQVWLDNGWVVMYDTHNNNIYRVNNSGKIVKEKWQGKVGNEKLPKLIGDRQLLEFLVTPSFRLKLHYVIYKVTYLLLGRSKRATLNEMLLATCSTRTEEGIVGIATYGLSEAFIITFNAWYLYALKEETVMDATPILKLTVTTDMLGEILTELRVRNRWFETHEEYVDIKVSDMVYLNRLAKNQYDDYEIVRLYTKDK